MRTPDPIITCTHELRPGTTVCLRCRRDARLAAARRARRTLMRATAGAVVLAVAGVAAFGAVSALRRGISTPATSPAASAPPVSPPASDVPAPAAAAAQAPTTAPRAKPPLAPVVGPGRTDLTDSVYVDRTADTVDVHFDLQMIRTRRPEKFEAILRETLGEVYGDPGRGALAAIPEGIVGDSAALVSELPERGLRLPLSGGWTIVVHPETRPGDAGPLVIGYKAVVVLDRE